MTNRMPELLCPAGNLESLEAALHFGADAVYGGMKQFGLRAFAGNFDEEALTQAVEKMHGAGKKFYLTMNIFPFDDQMDDFIAAAKAARDIGVDAAIVSDLGAIAALRREVPALPLHVSTQASTVNAEAVRVYRDMGCERVILARETSIARAKEIIRRVPEMEIETFVHGAMCISYSGRCLLSNYFTGRDANQGACTHPCRWKYSIVEETRPNEYMPVYENERGTYIFNSKDLCMIEHIPDLFDAGIDSFKIEGRMKTALYVATVARTYRKAIDDYKKSPELYQQNMPWYLDQISNCTYRQFTTGFFYGKPSDEAQIYDNNTYLKEYTYLGIVGGTNEEGLYRIEQRNKFSVGEQIEVMKPDGENIEVTVKRIVDEEGNDMESAPHPKQVLYIDLGHPLEMYDILRRKE